MNYTTIYNAFTSDLFWDFGMLILILFFTYKGFIFGKKQKESFIKGVSIFIGLFGFMWFSSNCWKYLSITITENHKYVTGTVTYFLPQPSSSRNEEILTVNDTITFKYSNFNKSFGLNHTLGKNSLVQENKYVKIRYTSFANGHKITKIEVENIK
jgi:hypothetical protein